MNKTLSLLSISTLLNFAVLPTTYADDIVTEINQQQSVNKKGLLQEFREKISLGYFANISGPTVASPSASYTYNKFNSGRDANGYQLDARSNQEVFNSLSITYKVNSNFNISYSYSFINAITTNTNYTYKQEGWMVDNKGQAIFDTDGYQKWGVMTKDANRANAQAFLNQRISAFIPSAYQNNTLGLSMGISYEMPTTQIAKDNNMLYGLVLSPTLYFKTKNIKHAYGISSTIQRDFYKENVFQSCKNCIPIEMRTLTASLVPYYNYSIANKLTLMTRLTFDYDQQGKQSGLEFGNNMDNVARIGLGYSLSNNINTSIYVEGDMEDPRSDRSFIGATIGIAI